MKGRLDQAALAAMKFAFAGEQAFAEQNFSAFQKAALGEIGLMGDQNVLDPIGIADQVDILRAKAEMDEFTMVAGGGFEK
jgi:hypothetical protein